MRPAEADEAPSPRALRGWTLLLALLLYTILIHYGVGPRPEGELPRWYDPREFLLGWAPLAPLLEGPARAIASLGLPALALAVASYTASRSSLALALGLSCTATVGFFLYYGVHFPLAWRFFHWRGSVVMGLTGAFVGFALAAPFLAASWLRRSWPLRLALYLPIFCAALAFARNATGTDPALSFSISPWPAVPVFGLEVAALCVAACLVGLALGCSVASAVRRHFPAAPTGSVVASALLAFAAAAALLAAGRRLGMLPFEVGAGVFGTLSALNGLAAAGLASVGVRQRPEHLARRSHRLTVGAALIALPLLLGQVLTRYDYVTTRDLNAQQIIDALQAYFERGEVYPDSLEELVAAGDLRAIPRPQIGFALLRDARFGYQSFGTSYVLDFDAPRWVQCAYTPPWKGGEEDLDEGDGESLAGVWSCPSDPPELW